MKVSFLGLGKLGLPCALAIESKGHDVVGYDVSPKVRDILRTRKLPYRELGAQELLDKTQIKVVDVPELVKHGDIIFVPIQTPHDMRYEGTTELPEERVDFDYSFLKSGLKTLSEEIEWQGKDKIVIIISTVLPGTIQREIKPLLGPHVKLCYNPFFIAMGTTIRDFLFPEFVLFGVDDPDAVKAARDFYKTITEAPLKETSIANAEAIKVAYNTAIGAQIVLANTWMEIAHKMNLNVDEITNALKMANRRIVGWNYFGGGMGDGGGCHPRDCIALSHLARKNNLSFDFFEALMVAREKQTDWLATLMIEESEKQNLPLIILGTSYKPETNLTVGSPALLLKNLLEKRGKLVMTYDPYVDGETSRLPNSPAVFLIGTKHPDFTDYNFPRGSVVLDVWRYIPKREGVDVRHIGNPLS